MKEEGRMEWWRNEGRMEGWSGGGKNENKGLSDVWLKG